MINIKASKFVKRQTRGSEFSYFDGSWEYVEELVTRHFSEAEDGYRDGVVLVPVPALFFFSSVVPMDNTIACETVFEPRREGEDPVQKRIYYGKKLPAKYVDLVLYRKDVLEEDPLDRDDLTGADWEIVSINATAEEDMPPMTPMTMARNQLADDPKYGKGGTIGAYSGEEYARSIMYWNDHIMVREP
jgi:hypothetical protein